jgi:hypothetical protein
MGWVLDLLHLIHSHSSGLQDIQLYCYSTHFPVHRCTRTRILSLHELYPGYRFITVSLALEITCEVFMSQSNSFLAISSQSLLTAISRTRPNSLPTTVLYSSTTPVLLNTSYNNFAQTPRKTPSSIIKNACLLACYLAMDVLLLLRVHVLRECVYWPTA